MNKNWKVEDSTRLYAIDKWGAGHFSINESGEVTVDIPFQDQVVRTPIIEIINGIKARGLSLPAILRIENLLDLRVQYLNEAFREAIKKLNYQNSYKGVFPIKVNQQCDVIKEIAEFGEQYEHGFEAGSKAELILAISQLKNKESLIICNGYKDKEFIELGLYARKLGFKCFFVLETPTELPLILKCSQRLGIDPLIGVRVKSYVKVDGHWQADSGEQSIFGLSIGTLMDSLKLLRKENKLHCLQLIHCHLGSQIPNLDNIRQGVKEICQFYQSLVAEGANMQYIDLGGGLAVDYQGNQSNSTNSMNYGLDEYCLNIVAGIKQSMDKFNLPHPVIITESGRATVAYSSMLLFNVIGVRSQSAPPNLPDIVDINSKILFQLKKIYDSISPKNYVKSFNQTLEFHYSVRKSFVEGKATLNDCLLSEQMFLTIMQKIAKLIEENPKKVKPLAELKKYLNDIYYCNFSLFRSLPDMWAIDQLFPIMPIQRLNEKPTREAILADITCDCDGKIDQFITDKGVESTLPVHPVLTDEEYILSVFLVGAYQETMGDLHNLFGDTHVLGIYINPDGTFDFRSEYHGDIVSDVLSYIEFDPKEILEGFRKMAENAVQKKTISIEVRQKMLKKVKSVMDNYTFLEPHRNKKHKNTE